MLLKLLNLVPEWVDSIIVKNNSIIINIDRNQLKSFLSFFKFFFDSNYSSLMDIWGSDYPHRPSRFEVNYMLLNYSQNYRIIIRTQTTEYNGLPSVTGLFNSSGWLEREVWDMYGVFFHEHTDLRRILTDYGFSGYPLRKDFPLTGYTEVRYDDTKKQVVSEPLEISQEFRLFNFKSPWENNYLD